MGVRHSPGQPTSTNDHEDPAVTNTDDAIDVFRQSVRASCDDAHPELDGLVAWARVQADAGLVRLTATRSEATSVLRLILPGERVALTTANHDITGIIP
jgi:hypothetical protein